MLIMYFPFGLWLTLKYKIKKYCWSLKFSHCRLSTSSVESWTGIRVEQTTPNNTFLGMKFQGNDACFTVLPTSLTNSTLLLYKNARL